jgi:hypothetical protein
MGPESIDRQLFLEKYNSTRKQVRTLRCMSPLRALSAQFAAGLPQPDYMGSNQDSEAKLVEQETVRAEITEVLNSWVRQGCGRGARGPNEHPQGTSTSWGDLVLPGHRHCWARKKQAATVQRLRRRAAHCTTMPFK